MHLEWLDCDPVYRLYAVSWEDVTGTDRRLGIASSNLGPWSHVVSVTVTDGCYFPAQNLKWYRITRSNFPFGSETVDKVWVPRYLCESEPW